MGPGWGPLTRRRGLLGTGAEHAAGRVRDANLALAEGPAAGSTDHFAAQFQVPLPQTQAKSLLVVR